MTIPRLKGRSVLITGGANGIGSAMVRAFHRQGAKVFNSPQALRDHNEKFAIAEFAKFTVPSLVSRRMADLQGFIDQQKTADLWTESGVVARKLDVRPFFDTSFNTALSL